VGALIDIIAPLEQEGTTSVVRTWLVKVGDVVSEHDPLVELETDKVAVEVPAPQPGVVAEILLQPGANAGPGEILARLKPGGGDDEIPVEGPALESDEEAAPQPAPEEAPAEAGAPAKPTRAIGSFDPALRLSPSVRRFLVERDIDPQGLVGTGRGGRLTRSDVEGAAAGRTRTPAARAQAPEGGVERVPHDPMRLRIAEHMVKSLSTAPHVTAVFEADFSAIMAHRKANRAAFEQRGVNLTYTAYLVAASTEAMNVAPAVNSRWHEDHLEIFSDVNVGVGTALGEKGLIVPVIKQAQNLDLFSIAQRLHDVTERARANRLSPADVRDGTFSISNHGVSGSLVAAPIIINQPQSAILGVGKLEKRVVVREVDGQDAILIRPMAFVSLSIDHRVLDGHQTNAWLTRFVEVLETWPAA
jgi:2-oxoglutarate dehydrogenase E2 component (dihydrolipoamide succinyltransferase)